METFVQELVNSLSVASVIILIGIGVTLIFGLTGIINFAHGEFLMVGGIAVWVLVSHGMSYVPALLLAIIVVGALGFALESGLFQFTLRKPNNGFMASLGLQIVLQHIVIRNWNSYQKSIPEPLPGVWVIGGIRIIIMRAVVVAVTALVVAITFVTISRSRYGLALRASLADRDTAALMGIPIRRYITAVFVYGSMIAGLGGGLMIALFPSRRSSEAR
jgi:branched-chain amino acid transport system permease protein